MPTDREFNVAVRDLYLAMPGAPPPPKDEEGYAMWGEIEGNEQWEFCAAIVRMMRREAGYAVSSLASEHNLV